ncbi:ABC transporter ATP-binding protein [Roseiterribacter gracilis]|uniref:Phosphonate ABC transporter ATP-binding protein n=1 Tax=Roseiterribacter gracilis TaxID=2812848 RepID=A0A8S8XFE2_9PROT|nr:phosphonate ABC transporter ATP-binding protein [Rhodospirillales bacterium TMPK1]
MIRLENVTKSYRTDEVETTALADLSLAIDPGEFVAIMGPSGCGKSTLLNILGLLDKPDGGRMVAFGEEVSDAGERKLARLRADSIGFVFQSFNLIDELTVEENVEVSLLYGSNGRSNRKQRVADALSRVGMAHRARHRPQQLSGGQQQRVAIARAIASDPKLILADEPTGNLDTKNGDDVMALLGELNRAGRTVVMVTHSPDHAAYAKRTVSLLDGRVVAETRNG